MTRRLLLVATVLVAIAWALPAGAQAPATANLTINATVAATARLTISTSALNFPDSDPDTTTTILPSEGTMSITAKVKTASTTTVRLTLNAAGDLSSGSATIPISNITWTAGGTGFVAGTLAVGSEVPVASWTGPGSRLGTQSFTLLNSWDYAVGSYSASATYTLSAT